MFHAYQVEVAAKKLKADNEGRKVQGQITSRKAGEEEKPAVSGKISHRVADVSLSFRSPGTGRRGQTFTTDDKQVGVITM